ncbi:MAG: electron transfer flavoprotein subunit beta/FixA family protein [Anaerolineaceae bacterium]|nr:MAG: electron transfer flavoprotein subunit beta/FixA family protein [Anaerolineaceae bacterium]
MNIVVCVKQTPDTAAIVTVEDGVVSWGDAPVVLNPWDEYAVEEALRIKEAHGGEITAISLGPEDAKEALKQALAMGCDQAILISDPVFAGADTLVVSKILAASIDKIEGTDLVIFGRASVDSDTGVTGPQVARRLGWPALSLVAAISSLDPEGKTIAVERMLDEGRQLVSSPLPAVVSVVKEINEPRYPSFMGIRKASRAEIPLWTAAELGLDEISDPAVMWPDIMAPPKIETEVEMIEGETPEEIAARLVDRLMEEKVI